MPGRLHFVLSNVAWLKRVPMDFGGTSLAYSYAMSGVFGGLVTVSLPASSWTQSPLRESGLAGHSVNRRLVHRAASRSPSGNIGTVKPVQD
jgi:hypothetical protein